MVFSLLGTTSTDPFRGLSDRMRRFVPVVHELERRAPYCSNKAVKGDASSPCCAGLSTLLMHELEKSARRDGRAARLTCRGCPCFPAHLAGLWR